MEITCTNFHCHRKFKPPFVEDNYVSKLNQWEYDPVLIKDQSCFCPHCNHVVYLSEIDPFERDQVLLEQFKIKHPERFDDEEEEDTYF
jgi:hypothetical protein